MTSTGAFFLGITQDDAFIYWSEHKASSGSPISAYTISRIPREGGSAQVLFTMDAGQGWIQRGAIAVAGDSVYVIGNLTQPSHDIAEVVKVPKAGGPPVSVETLQVPQDGHTLAIDREQSLYFTRGGALHELSPLVGAPASHRLMAFEDAYPKHFAVRNGTFAWSGIIADTEGPKEVVAAETFAPAYKRRWLYKAPVSAGFHPNVIAASDTEAFFGEAGSVKAVPLGGGGPRVVANEQGNVTDILLGDDSVYWVAATSVNTSNTSRRAVTSRLYRASTAGGAGTVIVPSIELPVAGHGYVTIGKCDIVWISAMESADGKLWGSTMFRLGKNS